MGDDGVRFAGFLAVMVLGAVAASTVGAIAGDHEFLAMLATVSPWAASQGAALGYVATGIVMLATLAIPPLMLMRDTSDRGERLETVGWFAMHMVVVYALLFIAIPGVAYLLGVGWFAARKALGA